MENEITMEHCVNLCELIKQVLASGMTIGEYVEQVRKEKGWDRVGRIYIGSYFCSHYFLHLTEWDFTQIFTYAKQADCKITLVLPVFTQKNLGSAKKFLDRLSCRFDDGIDEITVNDYGMLVYISSKYCVRVNLGRLFMKDYRDPRYPEYFNQVFSPAGFTKSLYSFIKKYRIHMVELDPTHRELDLSNKPDKVRIAIHTPFCYMTTGQICEYASIAKPLEKKFRPNMECEAECLTHHIEYELEELDPARRVIRLGRTVYFENGDCVVRGADTLREIVFSLDIIR